MSAQEKKVHNTVVGPKWQHSLWILVTPAIVVVWAMFARWNMEYLWGHHFLWRIINCKNPTCTSCLHCFLFFSIPALLRNTGCWENYQQNTKEEKTLCLFQSGSPSPLPLLLVWDPSLIEDLLYIYIYMQWKEFWK